MAWQNRGELAPFMKQLGGPELSGNELVPFSGSLIKATAQEESETIEVLEGIAVVKKEELAKLDQ
jgi:hypothetical protein